MVSLLLTTTMIAIGPPKPDPALVFLLAEKLGVNPAVSRTLALIAFT